MCHFCDELDRPKKAPTALWGMLFYILGLVVVLIGVNLVVFEKRLRIVGESVLQLQDIEIARTEQELAYYARVRESMMEQALAEAKEVAMSDLL